MRLLALAASLSLALAACDQMAVQPRYDAYGEASLFKDGKVLQAPPDGVVSQDDPAQQAALDTPPPMTAALLARGRERYGVFCAVCHDAAGYGDGVVPARGFPHPPSLHEAGLRATPASHLVAVIGQGYGVMYGYGDRVPPADRWAIAAYIRALQLSQAAPVSALSPQDRESLEAVGG